MKHILCRRVNVDYSNKKRMELYNIETFLPVNSKELKIQTQTPFAKTKIIVQCYFWFIISLSQLNKKIY